MLFRSTEPNTSANFQRQSPRRFEAKWLQEKDVRDVVQKAWQDAAVASSHGGVLNRLGHMHKVLHDWDRNILKSPKHRLRKAQRAMDTAMNGPMNSENESVAKEMADLIEMLLEQEEIQWMQRSRANWLR